MRAGKADNGETMEWYVEPDHFGARHTASALSRRRHADRRINSLAFAVTSALLFVLVAGAVMFGGPAAIVPLLQREAAPAPQPHRTGAIVYAMPDGVYCRRMAFDNTTAALTSVAVERCPGAIGVAGGPGTGKFDWGHR
jgi:hypothetical protein